MHNIDTTTRDTKNKTKTHASLLAVRAFSNVYTQWCIGNDRRWQVEQIGLAPSHRDLRSRHGSHASGIFLRLRCCSKRSLDGRAADAITH